MLMPNRIVAEYSRIEIDPLDVYVFDCAGLVVIRNVFPKSQIETCKAAINSFFPQRKPWKFSVLGMGEIFWDIMTNKIMLAMAEQLCGEQFRLDHAFSVTSDERIVNLHGGAASSYGSCFTKIDNSLYVGQLACGVPLTTQSSETGGMCYVPGSHRSIDCRTGSEIKKSLFKGNMSHEAIVTPTLNPGDLVIFSESLVHGDTGWKPANYSRLIVYYKFCPGFMTWRDPRDQEQFRKLARNDLERRLMEPPWSGKFLDSGYAMSLSNLRRDKTLL